MPDDGNRYEFIGGRLYMTPAPVIRHQRVSKRLQSALMRLLEHPGHGEVFHAQLLVEFPGTGDRVQPDLLFVSEREARDHHGEGGKGRARPGGRDPVPVHRAPRPRDQA